MNLSWRAKYRTICICCACASDLVWALERSTRTTSLPRCPYRFSSCCEGIRSTSRLCRACNFDITISIHVSTHVYCSGEVHQSRSDEKLAVLFCTYERALEVAKSWHMMLKILPTIRRALKEEALDLDGYGMVMVCVGQEFAKPKS